MPFFLICFIIRIGENMNNKGFTLIELLAVVILLITISLFVMPRIVDANDQNEDVFEQNIRPQKLDEYVGQTEIKENFSKKFGLYRQICLF